MENKINWVAGDILVTYNATYVFTSQYKGRLYFNGIHNEFIESSKIISDMLLSGDWKQIKPVNA